LAASPAVIEPRLDRASPLLITGCVNIHLAPSPAVGVFRSVDAKELKMRLGVLGAALSLLLGSTLAESNLTTPRSTQHILQGDFKPPQVWENSNLVRNTNLEKSYVRETINLVVKNVDKAAQSEYYFPVGYDVIGNIGGFEVRDKKDEDKPKFEVTTAALAAVLDGDLASK
jgi:hypothetical protein